VPPICAFLLLSLLRRASGLTVLSDHIRACMVYGWCYSLRHRYRLKQFYLMFRNDHIIDWRAVYASHGILCATCCHHCERDSHYQSARSIEISLEQLRAPLIATNDWATGGHWCRRARKIHDGDSKISSESHLAPVNFRIIPDASWSPQNLKTPLTFTTVEFRRETYQWQFYITITTKKRLVMIFIFLVI